MIAFSNRLGELAGQDILLWREAGLDPRLDLTEAGAMDAWPRGLARAVVRIWSCRAPVQQAGVFARMANRSDLRASFSDDSSHPRPPFSP